MVQKRAVRRRPVTAESVFEHLWHVPRDWEGQDGFVIAGGTSVTQEMVDSLKGRNVVAVNSSYTRAPWAPILFFADLRWWNLHKPRLVNFGGILSTISQQCKGSKLKRLKKVVPKPGAGIIFGTPYKVAMQRTSLQAAMNILVHKGCSRIILLGADMRPGASGRLHHHEEHPWKVTKRTWDVKLEQMEMAVEPLAKAGIPVINCSPISVMPWWPKADLRDVLAEGRP